MARFEIEVEFATTATTNRQLGEQVDRFVDALGVASGTFGCNALGNLAAMFPVDAESLGHATRMVLDDLARAATAAGLDADPHSLTVMPLDAAQAASQACAESNCRCACHLKHTSG